MGQASHRLRSFKVARANKKDLECAGSLLLGGHTGTGDSRGLAAGVCLTGILTISEMVFLQKQLLPPSEDQ